jgi:hypothetical protein
MGRPCGHADALLPPTGSPWDGKSCRVCWLYVNDLAYKVLYDREADNDIRSLAAKVPRCPHLYRRVRNEDGSVRKRWCSTG